MINQVKFELKFDDFDHFAEKVGHAEMLHTQLDGGFFEGELTQVIHGPLIVSTQKMNRTILQQGAGVKGYTTFLIPGNMEQDISWRKNRLTGNVIGILHSNMEHRGITKSNLYATPVSIKEDFLLDTANLLGYPNFIKFIRDKESIKIDVKHAKQIHQLVAFCCKHIISDSHIFNYTLPKLIISAISESDPIECFKKGNSRGIIFNKAQEIIHQNFEEPIGILSLCREIGVSERNLRYAFKEFSGLPPHKYVRYFKLNKVRKLIRAGKVEKIIEAANQMGFWHSGQFAADYKKLFGEFPSNTKRSEVQFIDIEV